MYRPEKGRVIAGVALAIANYFKIDVAIVRIILILFALNFSGVVLYVILWLLIPREQDKDQKVASEMVIKVNAKEIEKWFTSFAGSVENRAKTNSIRVIFGVIILGFGVLLLMRNLGVLMWFSLERLWPLLLVGAGIIFIIKRDEK